MSRNFNVEELGKLDQAVELLEEVIPLGKKGIENSKEIAQESGAEKYIKSAEALEEGAQAFFACIGEFVEVAKELTATYKRLDAGLNG